MKHSALALLLCTALAACSGNKADGPLLEDVASDTALAFAYANGGTGAFRVREIIGGGAALLDFDGDGDLDVYLVQGQAGDGAPPGNALFLNRLVEDGELRFERLAGNAADEGYGIGVAVADVDADGDPDLLVTNVGEDRFYRNDSGRFTAAPGNWGMAGNGWSTSASFCDYDRDGDVDLYVAAYLELPEDEEPECRHSTGRQDYCSPAAFDFAADRLWRNDGTSAEPRFVDASREAGVALTTRPALGVVCADLNADGWPDFYVANDREPNRLWINRGDGSFEDEGLERGAALNASGLAEASMGVAILDRDADGDLDLFVTHFDPETNTYYENDGQGRFTDATARLGLAASSTGYTGWGTGALDANGDGRPDLFVANGGVLAQADRLGLSDFPYEQVDQLFLNARDQYTALALETGLRTGRGAAFGDVDNDGDHDVLVVNNSGPVNLLLNTSPVRSKRLILLPVDSQGRVVDHAAVTVAAPGMPLQRQHVHRDGSYLSASDSRLVFAVGSASSVAARVEWPDGSAESWQLEPGLNVQWLQKGQGRADAP
ncbi:MAG: CRTAC1 family protein [Pseudomonadota bacterium]